MFRIAPRLGLKALLGGAATVLVQSRLDVTQIEHLETKLTRRVEFFGYLLVHQEPCSPTELIRVEAKF